MTAHLLRGGEDFTLGGAFEPVSTTSRLVVDLCGITAYGESASEVLDSFTSPTGLEGYRGAIGYRFQRLSGTTWGNISGADTEWEFGAPSIRAINIVEHPQKANTWQIDMNETTMGRRLSDAVPVGNPNLSANMVTRPRNVNAWRTEDPSSPLPQQESRDAQQTSDGTAMTIWAALSMTSTSRDIQWISGQSPPALRLNKPTSPSSR